MSELLLRGLALLAEWVLEVVVGHILYITGWLALRLLTLGRYPAPATARGRSNGLTYVLGRRVRLLLPRGFAFSLADHHL